MGSLGLLLDLIKKSNHFLPINVHIGVSKYQDDLRWVFDNDMMEKKKGPWTEPTIVPVPKD